MAARAPDVIVVGGGIVGAAAAAEAARRGARTVLLERADIASAASGRNSGAVWQPTDPVLDALYRESLARYRALEQDPAAGAVGFALPEQPAGILALGRDVDAIRATVAGWQATHPWLGATFVDDAELARLEPSVARGVVACRLDIGFPVAPAAATRAFAAVATESGATVERATVAVIVREHGRVRGVIADGRRLAADSVVLAAGPWTPELLDPAGRWRPIRPFWGVVVEIELAAPPRHVLEAAGIEDAIAPGALRAPRTADEAEGVVDFSLVTAAGRSALGSTFLPLEPDPAAFVDRLVAGGAVWVPAIAMAAVRGVRACARPVALDGRPLVGPVPGVAGLFVAAGHGPWGISTGPASGMHVAALALGDRDGVPASLRAALDPARFGIP